MRKEKWYVADFETTTEDFYYQNGYTKVWLYAISDELGKIINYGYSIEEFFSYLKQFKENVKIYFHNLKFDGSFILNYLLSNDYKHLDAKIDKNSPNKIFSTLIDEMGVFYSITLKLENCIITFYDSFKLLPFKVEKIAKDFDLPLRKGKIDYSNYVINDETLEYVFGDVIIVALALKQIKDLGMTKMTTASCAYNEYSANYKYIKLDFPQGDKDKLLEYRQAYRGGRSQLNPIYKNKILYNVKRYDINSMYPYIMYSMYLPYGKPIPITTFGNYKFEVYKLRIGFILKDNHIPSLLKKSKLYAGDDTYYTETDDIELLYITNIDYEILKKHYDIYYLEFIEGFGFKCSKNLFKEYIDKWYGIKNNSKGAKRIVAKTMLNSLYGKFGSNPVGRKKIPILDEMLKFEYTQEEDLKIYYLWLAMAVVSHAHLLLDTYIEKSGYDKFVYCDTDSIHTLGDLPQDVIDDKELGKFKLESIEKKSKYVRQKTYLVQEQDNSLNITCAGMPDALKQKAIELYNEDLFDVFEESFEIYGKLLPKQVKGGVILYATTFKII